MPNIQYVGMDLTKSSLDIIDQENIMKTKLGLIRNVISLIKTKYPLLSNGDIRVIRMKLSRIASKHESPFYVGQIIGCMVLKRGFSEHSDTIVNDLEIFKGLKDLHFNAGA